MRSKLIYRVYWDDFVDDKLITDVSYEFRTEEAVNHWIEKVLEPNGAFNIVVKELT